MQHLTLSLDAAPQDAAMPFVDGQVLDFFRARSKAFDD